MLEVSFDLLGHLLLNQILILLSITEYNRSVVTKPEDVVLIAPLILTEEILDPLMEVLELAKQLSPFQLGLLMEPGLFNGPGLEELSPSEITTLA
jgi:hypothetical protein